MMFLTMISIGAIALLETGCRQNSKEASRSLGFEEFVPVYNRYIESWLKDAVWPAERRWKAGVGYCSGDQHAPVTSDMWCPMKRCLTVSVG